MQAVSERAPARGVIYAGARLRESSGSRSTFETAAKWLENGAESELFSTCTRLTARREDRTLGLYTINRFALLGCRNLQSPQ